MEKLDFQNKINFNERPFNISNKLLLGAGPVNCSLRVLKALSLPALAPISGEMYKMMDEIQELTKYLFQTKNRLTFLQQTSGTGGLETALVNLVEPGEKVLIAISGVWGQRTALKAERAGMDVVTITAAKDEVFTLKEFEEQIIKHKPVLLSVTHSESSGGTLQPLEGIADICHKHNCLFFVDAVISIGTDPLFVDRWGIDVAIGATQKGLGAPPGMSLLTFSPRAEEKIFKRKSKIPMYFDVKSMADYWNCYGKPRMYCYTYNSNLLAGVRESLMQIAEEGLDNVWERHRICHEKFWSGLEKRGLELLVKDITKRGHAVTPVILPEDINWQKLYAYMDKTYLLEVGFGIGPSINNIRVGFMNVNCKPEIVDYFFKVLDDSIEFLRNNKYEAPVRSEVL